MVINFVKASKMATDQIKVNGVDKNKYKYSKVSLTLENCILPTDKFPTPSHVDGLESESEIELRILGCELIQTAGILLRLPQVTMATGQVLFQRFYYSKSFVRHPMKVVAMACIKLASKVEETPHRIRDIVNVFHHIRQVRSGKTIQPLILDQNYINLKNQIIKAEGMVLKSLGFCVHVKHPHKIIVTLLEVLKIKDIKIMQTAWNYMNDSHRTDVFVRYPPETIACACIYLSARLLQISLPNKPAWYLVFGASQKDINDISHIILSLYTRKKPDPEKLEKIVEALKKNQQEAKLKAKELSSQNKANASQPCSWNGIKSPVMNSKKEKSDLKHNDLRSKYKELNHHKRRSPSPSSDDYQSWKKRTNTSSSGSSSTSSSSPKRKKKMPPRGFNDTRRFRSHSRSKSTSSKKTKHHLSRKRSRNHSLSPSSPIHHNSSKKSYKNKHSKKSYYSRSRSRSHEHNHHRTNSVPEKSLKSRKNKVKNYRGSRDMKR